MNIWVLKAILQKCISSLPGSLYINHFFQRISSRFGLSEQEFTDKLIHLQFHLRANRQLSDGPVPGEVLELGTGWFPVVPLGYFLSGAERIVSVDIRPLLSKTYFLTTIDSFLKHYDDGVLQSYMIHLDTNRLEKLRLLFRDRKKYSLYGLCSECNIELRTGTVESMIFPGSSFQLITSNNTLEHISIHALPDIFRWFKETGGKDVVTSHFVDMSDHFSHLDKSITPYNFLKFRAPTWKWINNRIQPQNRERLSYYKSLFEKSGFPVEMEELRKGSPADLAKIKLAPEFDSLPVEDVIITHAWLAAKM